MTSNVISIKLGEITIYIVIELNFNMITYIVVKIETAIAITIYKKLNIQSIFNPIKN
jgi:hypothetical protein